MEGNNTFCVFYKGLKHPLIWTSAGVLELMPTLMPMYNGKGQHQQEKRASVCVGTGKMSGWLSNVRDSHVSQQALL